MRKKSNVSSNDRQKSGRQMVYQRGNQRDGSPHYVLLYSDDEHSGEEENIPLKTCSKTNNSSARKVEVIKIQLQPEDTLQALALKYRCTVSELKRINNIHKDNEIFAHRSIKVPVQPYSLLTETLNKIEDEGTSNSTYEAEKPSTSKEEQILNLITTPVVVPRKSEINNIILNSILEPAKETSENVEGAEDDQLLSAPDREVTPKSNLNDFLSCSGSDWGLSWPQLLGVFLLLGIAVPFIYILYIADASKHSIPGH